MSKNKTNNGFKKNDMENAAPVESDVVRVEKEEREALKVDEVIVAATNIKGTYSTGKGSPPEIVRIAAGCVVTTDESKREDQVKNDQGFVKNVCVVTQNAMNKLKEQGTLLVNKSVYDANYRK